MIDKVVSIRNVGKFDDCHASGPTSFDRLTLIFGENAAGKTTFTAILRSAQEGNSRILLERARLGPSTEGSGVELLVDGGLVQWKGASWSSTVSNLAIFDEVFISENVYAGDMVHPEQRLNLHRFALGEKAVGLAQECDRIADEIADLNTNLRNTEQAIQARLPTSMTLAQVVELKNQDNIDDLISLRERELAAVSEADDLRRRLALPGIAPPTFDFGALELLLQKTIADVSSEVETRVHEHLDTFVDDRAEEWIASGMKYAARDRCPFCAQALGSSDLYTTLGQYFNLEYTKLKDEIAEAAQHVDEELSEANLVRIHLLLQRNSEDMTLWSKYIDTPKITFPLDHLGQAWARLRDVLTRKLEAKRLSPLEPMPLDDLLSRKEEYLKAIANCVPYNEAILGVNLKIDQKKRELGSSNLQDAEQKLAEANMVKARFEEPLASLCSRREDLAQRKKASEALKDQKRSELQSLTESEFGALQTSINGYLSTFGADFSIVDTMERHYGGRPRLEYLLQINGQPVELDKSNGAGPGAHFGNTLSSGDKATLALAFFLARLDTDAERGQKTVVLNDPVSSLDGNRRLQTRQEVIRLAAEVGQLIVLSHDPFFLRAIWDSRLNKAQTKTLTILREGVGSTFRFWDIEKDTRSVYEQNFDRLTVFVEKGAKDEEERRSTARCIRPLLEANLKARYPGEFHTADTLGDMLGKIREAAPGSALSREQQSEAELAEINEFCVQYAHDEKPTAASQSISEGELLAFVQRALKLLPGSI